jgi:hypothetical protein
MQLSKFYSFYKMYSPLSFKKKQIIKKVLSYGNIN